MHTQLSLPIRNTSSEEHYLRGPIHVRKSSNMDDDSGTEELTAEEVLLAQHRKEKKELRAKIQQIKKNNKDKKNKKEGAEQIARLEEELTQRHEKELEELKNSTEQEEAVTNGVAELNVEENCSEQPDGAEENEDDVEDPNQGRRITKAEKRRQKKAKANREREARIKEERSNLKFSARNIEAEKMKKILQERSLKMHEIQPDGNCMYAAIAHQMEKGTTVETLRSQAGQFLRVNAEEFAPFITDPKTGDMLTAEQFEEYCNQVENSPAWGGQPELRALSQAMKRRIEVLQAEGAPIIFGEECDKDSSILLAYYRHYYGLGEHYNSVAKIVLENEDQEEQ